MSDNFFLQPQERNLPADDDDDDDDDEFFSGMVDRRKLVSLISSLISLFPTHCQRYWPLQILVTPLVGFEPTRNLSSGLVEWGCTVVITNTPKCQQGTCNKTVLRIILLFKPLSLAALVWNWKKNILKQNYACSTCKCSLLQTCFPLLCWRVPRCEHNITRVESSS